MVDGKPRVLVVDDASLVRLYYRKILESAGYAVEEALNGLEGLERVLEQPPDLAIVDVNMPQMDGFTFLATLREHPLPAGGTPALVVSTESGTEDRLAARRAGANFYLVKPVAEDALTQYVAMLCGIPEAGFP
jgi:two-component system chemotaxis response regulator CheY